MYRLLYEAQPLLCDVHTKRLSLASIFPCSNIFMEAKNYFFVALSKKSNLYFRHPNDLMLFKRYF